jgi:hypothetical protein
MTSTPQEDETEEEERELRSKAERDRAFEEHWRKNARNGSIDTTIGQCGGEGRG